MYEGILVDVAFAGFFLAKAGWTVTLTPSNADHDHYVDSGSESRAVWTTSLR